MTNVIKVFAALSASAFLLSACGGPSPDKVCAHMGELGKKEMQDSEFYKSLSDEDKKEFEKGMEEGLKECAKELEKKQKEDKAAYDKAAACVMKATKLEDAAKCAPEDKK